jgi:hypothetical protein
MQHTSVPPPQTRHPLCAERSRKANWEANKGRERKDLYSDRWQGDRYTGSAFNILNVILVVSVLVPLLGIAFALSTYGDLWG